MYGRRYRVINVAAGWGRERIFCHDGDRRVVTFPVGFTDYLPRDPFVVAAGGRSPFRARDLLELAEFVESLAKDAGGVK